jgi:hypothetical protein
MSCASLDDVSSSPSTSSLVAFVSFFVVILSLVSANSSLSSSSASFSLSLSIFVLLVATMCLLN